MASTEVGHHEAWVYRDQNGRLVVPSSAKILIEGSSASNLGSGAQIVNRNVQLTTSRSTAVSAGTLLNSGLTIILTTGVGTLRLQRPVKGSQKTIIWGSTAAKTVKLRVTPNVDTDDTVKIGFKTGGAGAICVYPSSDALVVLKGQKYACGPTLSLHGLSTSRWAITNTMLGSSGVKFWTFATST